MRRRIAILVVVLVAMVAYAAYRSMGVDPVAALYDLKPVKVETKSPEESFAGKRIRTFYFEGKAAYASLDGLKRSLLGKRGWYLRASDDNYAFFSNTLLAGQGSEVDWFLTDDQTGRAIVHAATEERQIDIGPAWINCRRSPSKAPIVISAPPSTPSWTQADADLGVASQRDDLVAAEDALRRGAKAKGDSIDDPGPLYWALTGKGLKVAELLVSKGANINALGINQRPLIEEMATSGKPDSIRFLYRHGARISHSTLGGLFVPAEQLSPTDMVLDFPNDFLDEGWLTDDAWKNSGDCATALIECGANVNQLDSDKRGPLFYAAKNGNASVFKVLLDHGAVASETKDRFGTTMRDVAVKRHRNEWRKVVQLIDEREGKKTVGGGPPPAGDGVSL